MFNWAEEEAKRLTDEYMSQFDKDDASGYSEEEVEWAIGKAIDWCKDSAITDVHMENMLIHYANKILSAKHDLMQKGI